VSGEDTTGRGASGGRGADGDEAAWRDLIARFDTPVGHPGATPWPDRESLTPPAPGGGPDDAGLADLETGGPETADAEAPDPEAPDPEAPDPEAPDRETPGPETADRETPGPETPGPDPLRSTDRARVIRPATPQPNGISVPLPPFGAAGAAGAGLDRADAIDADGDDDDDVAEDDHFVPPPPPPLPHLDSVAKGAWTALFGGPAYLLVATLMGWVVPGWAALLAVMAFVGGFAVVAVRLGDRRTDDTGPDDGAVL
jgi:hypothetical protein